MFWLSSLLWAEDLSYNDAIRGFNKHAYFPIPELDTKQIQHLKKGEVVRMLDRASPMEPRRAIGMIILNTSKEAAWVAYRDPHYITQNQTQESLIFIKNADQERWYGYLDLPWPFSDRHWLIDVWNNHKLATESSNKYWEHPWELTKDGEDLIVDLQKESKLPAIATSQAITKAILTPVNRGAWFAITIEDQTLLGYHCTSVVGGNIPEGPLAQYVLSSIEGLLKPVKKRAESEVSTHYDSNHQQMIGGDGQIIKPFQ